MGIGNGRCCNWVLWFIRLWLVWRWLSLRGLSSVRIIISLPAIRLNELLTIVVAFHCSASLLTAIIFHQLFEGLSLGIRIAALPSSTPEGTCISVTLNRTIWPLFSLGGFVCLPEPILKPVLAFTFAITTPIGIALGLTSFGGGRSAGGNEVPSMIYIYH